MKKDFGSVFGQCSEKAMIDQQVFLRMKLNEHLQEAGTLAICCDVSHAAPGSFLALIEAASSDSIAVLSRIDTRSDGD
jgi:hypothetical protein